MTLQGACNCGAIKVTIPDDVQPAFCRCMNCRKQSGALGTYVALVADEDVTVTGSPKAYEDPGAESGKLLHRWFCGNCGSPVMSTTEVAPGKKFIKMGLFDEIPKPVIEVYCRNKPEWEPFVEGTHRTPGAP